MFHGLFYQLCDNVIIKTDWCWQSEQFVPRTIFEDYDCPFLEDYYRKKEEQCDFEVEGEDDGWLGTENHRCPLLDFSYHYFVGRRPLRFMDEMDVAIVLATCQLAIFIAPVERETATKHVW